MLPSFVLNESFLVNILIPLMIFNHISEIIFLVVVLGLTLSLSLSLYIYIYIYIHTHTLLYEDLEDFLT